MQNINSQTSVIAPHILCEEMFWQGDETSDIRIQILWESQMFAMLVATYVLYECWKGTDLEAFPGK